MTSQEGLQPERTGLAWQRTALAAAACTLLLAHGAAQEGWRAATVPTALAALGTLTMAVIGRRRAHALRRNRMPGPPGRGQTGAVAALVLLTALAALLTLPGAQP
ncbi:DUF202 domain-containing protein [Amycolatopsis aidingensis]|uniref:DUF202 domain-containing protein n=1 Tax=Amycolatopsis aidingensis TaxID=2842453 RepID=UPI001C0D9D5C|nr:DUF202 domain-containing protein [Amycolatopsis aidingensis]